MGNLAINGGSKITSKELPAWPVFSLEDRNNLLKTYESGSWGPGGSQSQRLEKSMAEFSKVKYCIPVANGTVSISLILRALGIGRGDEVIIPPFTFIATISSLIYAGVTPVFADIDPETTNLSPESAERAITPKTKAIMPVYIGGRPAEMEKFETLCKKHGLYLIGDAAQAIGSEYDGRGIGSYGIAASVSCQNTKNLTCGEGGLILTNDKDLNDKIRRMLSGGTDESGRIVSLGMAYGMSEWQASMLNSQLPKTADEIALRMENAAYLDEAISKLDFCSSLKKDPRITRNTYHIYTIMLHKKLLKGVSRETFLKALNAEGIPLSAGYTPMYDFPCIKGKYASSCLEAPVNIRPDTPVLEYASRHEICWLPQNALLGTRSDMDSVIRGLIKVYEHLDELK